MAAITLITGRALPLRGDDLDTDRIMPARFLRAVTFEGLENHLFEDDRAADARHPFNDARYKGAAILVVNSNFGCGSSREATPRTASSSSSATSRATGSKRRRSWAASATPHARSRRT